MSMPPPPAPAGAQPSSEKPKAHAISKIAFGAAIVGFIFACIPGALIVGWVLLPIAFILAIVAFFKEGPKGLAVTALIVSIVGTIVGFVVFLAVVVDAVDDAVDDAKDELDSSGDYAVTIDRTHKANDYEGHPVLVVDYTFTNNGDDDANFLVAVTATAFQDGVELEDAILENSSKAAGNTMKDIKPGKSIKVEEAYVLDGKKDVTIEVSGSFALDDEKIATKTVHVR